MFARLGKWTLWWNNNDPSWPMAADPKDSRQDSETRGRYEKNEN